VGKLASQFTDAAETRNWLMLPYEIRVTRIPLNAGSHSLDVSSEVLEGKPALRQSQDIIMQEDELQVVQVRSMPYLNQAESNPAVNKIQKAVALIEQ
jgi:hypothetical protein